MGRLDWSPKKNWVEKAGGLPKYIEDIALALIRDHGFTRSRAIATAVSRVKKWARGGDDVLPDTRAKALAALAQWEALKLKNRARRLTKGLPVDETKRLVPTAERRRLAKRGAALPDGSFPINSEQDLKNAIHAIGRAKDQDAARRHIIRCARKMKLEHLLPSGWNEEKDSDMIELEHKSMTTKQAVEVLDEEKGIVRAIISVTGLKDNVDDVIETGAFEKTLQVRNPKGVWSHDWKTPVSKTLSIKELPPGDSDLPKTLSDGSPWPVGAGAVIVTTQFNLNTTEGKNAFENVKFFDEDQEWSIGYKVSPGKATKKDGVRYIKELDLFEYSPVLFGAMNHARSMKSALHDHLSALTESVGSDALAVELKELGFVLEGELDLKGDKKKDDDENDDTDNDLLNALDEDEDDPEDEDTEESKKKMEKSLEEQIVSSLAFLAELKSDDGSDYITVWSLHDAVGASDNPEVKSLYGSAYALQSAIDDGDIDTAASLGDAFTDSIKALFDGGVVDEHLTDALGSFVAQTKALADSTDDDGEDEQEDLGEEFFPEDEEDSEEPEDEGDEEKSEQQGEVKVTLDQFLNEFSVD